MRTFFNTMLLFLMFLSSTFAELNCVDKNELPELDSLLVNGKLTELKNKIYSKFEVKHDTNFINYQINYFKNASDKIELLLNTITKFEEDYNDNIRNSIKNRFFNNRDKYVDTTLGLNANKMFQKCFTNDSIIYCYIAQYFVQRKSDLNSLKSSTLSPLEHEYFRKCTMFLEKFNPLFFDGKPDKVSEKVDSLITLNQLIMKRYRNKHLCLKTGFKKYMFFLNTIDEYSDYSDSLKIKTSEQIKSKEILYNKDIAGKKAFEQFKLFKNSDPFDTSSIYNFLLAKLYRTEHINKQKNQMRNQLNQILNLQDEKQYDEALEKLKKYRRNLPTTSTYKYFSDSLRYEYNKLEEEMSDQKYEESFWISEEKLNKNYQVLVGAGIQYNPPLMGFFWKFTSASDSSEFRLPIYKLRESFGLIYSSEIAFRLSSSLLLGVQFNYGNIYINKIIIGETGPFTGFASQETERVNNYIINVIEINLISKYYFRYSPGLNPYGKIAAGYTYAWRNRIKIEDLFSSKQLVANEAGKFLIKKETHEIHLTPELGVDFIKSMDSPWIISIYFQTTLMSGGMNQMLGHVRGAAGIKFGYNW